MKKLFFILSRLRPVSSWVMCLASRLLENTKRLLENTNQSSAGESPARESPARESPARFFCFFYFCREFIFCKKDAQRKITQSARNGSKNAQTALTKRRFSFSEEKSEKVRARTQGRRRRRRRRRLMTTRLLSRSHPLPHAGTT